MTTTRLAQDLSYTLGAGVVGMTIGFLADLNNLEFVKNFLNAFISQGHDPTSFAEKWPLTSLGGVLGVSAALLYFGYRTVSAPKKQALAGGAGIFKPISTITEKKDIKSVPIPVLGR